MKKIILFFTLFVSTRTIAQSVTIDPKSTANGIINAQSNNKGIVLPSNANPPTNIVAPSAGTMVYNSNTQTPNFFNGSAWQSVTASSAASMGYKNIKVFYPGNVNSPWTIPAGINKIMIEAWGGGGGAGVYEYNGGYLRGVGGGAGGYGITTQDVNPNDLILFTIGLGGSGGNELQTPTDGSATRVSYQTASNEILKVLGGYYLDYLAMVPCRGSMGII